MAASNLNTKWSVRKRAQNLGLRFNIYVKTARIGFIKTTSRYREVRTFWQEMLMLRKGHEAYHREREEFSKVLNHLNKYGPIIWPRHGSRDHLLKAGQCNHGLDATHCFDDFDCAGDYPKDLYWNDKSDRQYIIEICRQLYDNSARPNDAEWHLDSSEMLHDDNTQLSTSSMGAPPQGNVKRTTASVVEKEPSLPLAVLMIESRDAAHGAELTLGTLCTIPDLFEAIREALGVESKTVCKLTIGISLTHNVIPDLVLLKKDDEDFKLTHFRNDLAYLWSNKMDTKYEEEIICLAEAVFEDAPDQRLSQEHQHGAPGTNNHGRPSKRQRRSMP